MSQVERKNQPVARSAVAGLEKTQLRGIRSGQISRGRLWIDLANSPHVLLFAALAPSLRDDGWDIVVTARDHAQTLEIAQRYWTDIVVIGTESPPGRYAKGIAMLRRSRALERFAREVRPRAALSHGSYAQIVASAIRRVPAVTMMDYEYQPANHVSFRLAKRVIVPSVFPQSALRAAGASPEKVIRYSGFKEDLYLTNACGGDDLLGELEVDPSRVIVVMRTPPTGALYHRNASGRFDELLRMAASRENVTVVLLPRFRGEEYRYRDISNVVIPRNPVDGPVLLALADLVIGGGGTMSREAAILGTPTYTAFAGRLAAVDAELMRQGLLKDLRDPTVSPRFEKKLAFRHTLSPDRSTAIRETIVAAVAEVSR